jgi:hypothetical protein
MEKRVASPDETYAVERGELVVNGSHLAVSRKCVRLCLLRHGLDPESDHERLPAQVGRHILRISSFVLAFAMGRRTRAVAKTKGGERDSGT